MSDVFAADYRAARQGFRTAARDAGADVVGHRNPVARGPHGEDLITDVAWLGPASASNVLVAVSGTHGVEGYCGSACQIALLTGGLFRTVPADTAFLLVHALNPYGFAFDRRVDEDNVDLNRNFVDHDNPPANTEYASLHPLLIPADWAGSARSAADAALLATASTRGRRYVQSVVTSGQWTHPDGLFYGGTEPAWSHQLLADTVRTYLRGRRRIGYLDLHTGLGAWGVGEPIFRGGRDDGAHARARAWYGPQLSRSEDGTASSTEITGNTASLVAGALAGGAELTAITLEFGTLPALDVLNALRADQWLALQDTVDNDLRAAIKQQIRNAFYPDDAGWRAVVLARAEAVFAQAVAGLSEP